MKKITLLILLHLLCFSLLAQNNTFTNSEKYFQQEVNYNIEVALDDKAHTISGVAKIEYINNSPDVLSSIPFHLWANAYKNQTTAYAKQQIQNGHTGFFFAQDEELGGYESIDFIVDGKKSKWTYDEKNIDIAYLELEKKLLPEGRIEIEIPFIIKIPKYFSRMGHVNQAYYISQWYPKPAVYDQAGWHAMPYLDMGEFYSEFGKFDVKITLPENYVVAATGQLQTESEKAFLINKVRETNKFIAESYPKGADRSIPLGGKDPFPASSSQTKTIQFTAENIHDFAWFADKRFFVQKSQIAVSADNNVNTWAFFNRKEFHLWLDATKYLNQSVQFYSQKVGAYPYPQATAVSNPFAGAGAMEYPMITLVDRMGTAKDLDIVIAHEVGHNWFYGILAFNERKFPWMDEGINSHFEQLYTQNFYPDTEFLNLELPDILRTKGELSFEEVAHVSMQRVNVHQAITTPVEEMTEVNYGLGSYLKTADILRSRVTPLKMKSFYQQWKFKHPQPQDFIQHFDLEKDQVFDDLMNTTKKVDYKILSITKRDGYDVKIKNGGAIPVSFNLTIKAGDKKRMQMVKGFLGENTIHVTANEGEVIDQFIIDEERKIPEVNRKNNRMRTSGVFKKVEPVQLKFLAGLENPTRTTLSFMPVVGWNNYDKTSLGLLLHNNAFTPRNLEFAVAPMYGFASKNLVGVGQVKYNFFPENSLFQKVSLSLNAKRFTYNYNWRNAYYDDYKKLAPMLSFVFKKKKLTSSKEHRISLRSVNIFYNNGFTTLDNPEVQRRKTNYYVNEFKYTYEDSRVTGPLEASFTAQQGEGFVRLFANAKQFIPYRKKGKGVTLTGFAGVLPQYKGGKARAEFNLSGITSRFTQRDYMFDETLFGRSEGRGNSEGTDDGIFSQQIFKRDAGFKTLSDLGSSQDWMVSFGVSTSLPGPIPVRPYIDAAVYGGDGETPFAVSAGLAVIVFKDVFEIYLPLYENKTITEGTSYDVRNTFFKKISFLLDFNQLRKEGREVLKFY